jgi:hypothetical protein
MKGWSGTGSRRRPLLRAGGAASALLAALAIGEPVRADSGSEYRVIADEWVLSAGGLVTDFSTTAAVGTGNALGTIIRLEDELGLEDDKSAFRADGFYRFNPRHAIGFGYWSLNRSGSNIIADQIEWQGNVFDASVNLLTEFDIQWIRADWRYSFMRSERGEAGISLGLSTYDFLAALEGDATIGMAMTQRVRAEETIFAPVPTVGMFVNFAVTPNVLFRTTMNFLDLTAGDLEGEVSDISFVFEWYLSEHFGIGGGTSRTSIDYKDTGTDPFTIDYSQSGFIAYITFTFGDIE